MTLKPGDKVWMKGELDRIGSDGFVELGHWWNDDVKYLIPDVPNLAHIARYLAAHPETVDALETISGLAGDTMTSAAIRGRASGTQTYTMLSEHQQAQDLVDAFVKAMRGKGRS